MTHPGGTPDVERQPDPNSTDRSEPTTVLPAAPAPAVADAPPARPSVSGTPTATFPAVGAPTATFPAMGAPTATFPVVGAPTATLPVPGAPMSAPPASGLPYPPAPGWGQQPYATGPTVVPPPGMAGAGPAPAGKRGPLVPILAVLSALLFLGTAVTTVLYASEYGAHNRAKRTISQRDATLVARAAELEKTRSDLQQAQEELGKTKTDLTGSKNQADELKRQKQVIAKCFNLLGEVVTAASNGDRATVAKKQPELDAACNEAEKYTR